MCRPYLTKHLTMRFYCHSENRKDSPWPCPDIFIDHCSSARCGYGYELEHEVWATEAVCFWPFGISKEGNFTVFGEPRCSGSCRFFRQAFIYSNFLVSATRPEWEDAVSSPAFKGNPTISRMHFSSAYVHTIWSSCASRPILYLARWDI